jgi:hypothetical protein
MAPRKLDPAKRRAAGWACLGMFHALDTLRHMSGGISTNTLVRKDTFGEGLTEKEAEFVHLMESRLHKLALNYRKLGWRLLGKDERIIP